uniref:Putative SOUL heme-binding family protein n=1 Tax=Helianthus annuus TaxID=4232 RepID=A0A251UNM3_HELAN
MGMVLGKITVATPKFEVLHSTDDYEIRQYSPSVAAEVTYDPSELKGNKDGGFTILANYIGAMGNPRNTKTEKIDMTAPVITKAEKIDMTAPVVTKESGERVTMQFILPEKYTKAEEAPNGVANEAVVKEKVDKLKKDLERDGYKVAGEFVLARYNPPWTLPPFRTNEVMIPVE